MKTVTAMWAVAATLAVGSPASAQEASAQDSVAVVHLEGVRVEVPRPTTTTGGTSAVEVSVDSAGVVAAPTMEDFLRRMPLIQIRANSRGEAQPALRGAEDRQIAVLLDGIPLTLGWDHRTDLSVIPLTAVRQMTLLRGLSSMLHGPNVLGGALEFNVARGASRQPAPPPVTGAVSVEPGGGTNATATGGALFERDYSTWVVRGGAAYRNRSGVTVPDEAFRDPSLRVEFLAPRQDAQRLNSDRRQLDGFLSGRYLHRGGAWLSSLVSASTTRRGVPPEAHVSDPRLWRYPRQSRLFATVSGGSGMRTTAWGEGDMEVSIGVDRSVAEIDEFATAAYHTPVNGETGETTTFTGRLLGDHIFPDATEVRSAFTLADVTHTESFPSGDRFDYEQRLWSLGAEVEAEGARLLGRSGNGPGDGGARTGNGGVRVSLGASLDGANTPRSGDKPPLGTMWDWGLRAGATFAAHGGNVRYHAGISRRTRFPSLRELYSGALGRFEPNPGLRPERLIAGEAGVTFDIREAHLQVVGFHHHLYDGIVRSRLVTPDGTRFQRINRDDIRSTGIEMLAAGAWRRFTYGGDLTLQRVRIRDAGAPETDHRAEYEPTIAGNVNLTVEGPSRVAFTGFVHFRGTQFCENVETPALGQLNASATVDLEARRMFRWGSGSLLGRVEGTLGVSNLTDSSVLDQCGLPQPGRTFRAQINLR